MKFQQRILASHVKVGDTICIDDIIHRFSKGKRSGQWRGIAKVLQVGNAVVFGLENPNKPPLCVPLAHKISVQVNILQGNSYIIGDRSSLAWNVGVVTRPPRASESSAVVRTADMSTLVVPYEHFRCEAKPDALQYLYVRYMGIRCMYCCTYDIEVTGTRSAEDYMTQSVRCNMCHATWEDCLTLTRVVRGESATGLLK